MKTSLSITLCLLWGGGLLCGQIFEPSVGLHEEFGRAVARSHKSTSVSDVPAEDPRVQEAAREAMISACNNALVKLGISKRLDLAAKPELLLQIDGESPDREHKKMIRKVRFTFIPPPISLNARRIGEGAYYFPKLGRVTADVQAVIELYVVDPGPGSREQQVRPATIEKREGRDASGRKYEFLFKVLSSSFAWDYGVSDKVDTPWGKMSVRKLVEQVLDNEVFRSRLNEAKLLIVVGTASEEKRDDASLEYERARTRAFNFHQALRPLLAGSVTRKPPDTYMLTLGRYRDSAKRVAEGTVNTQKNDGKLTVAQRPLVLVSLIQVEGERDENQSDENMKEALLDSLKGHILDPSNYEGNPKAPGTFEFKKIEADLPVNK